MANTPSLNAATRSSSRSAQRVDRLLGVTVAIGCWFAASPADPAAQQRGLTPLLQAARA